jgi:hypothetical protein
VYGTPTEAIARREQKTVDWGSIPHWCMWDHLEHFLCLFPFALLYRGCHEVEARMLKLWGEESGIPEMLMKPRYSNVFR